MNKTTTSFAIAALALSTTAAQAQVSISALGGFGSGGFLAPGSAPYLTTDNTQRGLAYNAATGNLLLVNRAGGLSLNVLNGLTGASVGTLDTTGVTGGTYTGSTVGVSSDGKIYLANLTTSSTTSPFKVYRYESEAAGASSGPTAIYSGSPTSAAARFGDSFDVIGSGTNVTIVAGAGSNPAGFNGYAVIQDSGTDSATGSYVSFAGNPPASGDFRLGITFAGNANTVYGKQGGVATGRYTTYSGETGTLVGSNGLTAAAESILDVANVGGMTLLATLEYSTSNVRIYDFSDPLAPVLKATANLLPGASNANSNGVGAIKFGAISGNTATLYALNPNNGIQAFQIQTVPEPASMAALALGAAAFLRRRRKA